MSEKAKSEMSRMIQERLESKEWDRRMADAVLERVENSEDEDELRDLRKKRTLRAIIAGAAAVLLLSITAYGAYDFTRPVNDDAASLGYFADDDAGTDDLDSDFDSAAVFD